MRPVSDLQRRVAPFQVISDYQPAGDQPEAIEELVRRINVGEQDVVLLGATGTGKSATTAWMIERLQRPTLVLVHNKTLAAQLAIYLGYVHHRILGATVAGFAFVLPSFLMVVALGMAYVSYGGLPWMQAVFYGVGAAVLGIMAIGAHKLSTKSIGKDKLLWAIFGVLAAVTIIMQSEIAWLFIAAGLLVWVIRCKPGLQDFLSILKSKIILGLIALSAVGWVLFEKYAEYIDSSLYLGLLTQIGRASCRERV